MYSRILLVMVLVSIPAASFAFGSLSSGRAQKKTQKLQIRAQNAKATRATQYEFERQKHKPVTCAAKTTAFRARHTTNPGVFVTICVPQKVKLTKGGHANVQVVMSYVPTTNKKRVGMTATTNRYKGSTTVKARVLVDSTFRPTTIFFDKAQVALPFQPGVASFRGAQKPMGFILKGGAVLRW